MSLGYVEESGSSASDAVKFSNTGTGLVATNVQDALAEINTKASQSVALDILPTEASTTSTDLLLVHPSGGVPSSQTRDQFLTGVGTVTSIMAGTGLSGGTITESGMVALDIDGLLEEKSNHQLDTIAIYDASAGGVRKQSRADFLNGAGTVTSVIAGEGLSGGPITTTGTIDLDFSALQTKMANNPLDIIVIRDIDTGDLKQQTRSDFLDGVGGGGVTSVTAGVGLSGGVITTSGTIDLNITGLVSSTVNNDADTIAIYDASLGGMRQQTRGNFLYDQSLNSTESVTFDNVDATSFTVGGDLVAPVLRTTPNSSVNFMCGVNVPDASAFTGAQCVFIGNKAGQDAVSTSNSISIGTNTAQRNQTGNHVIAVGSNSCRYMMGRNNIGIGDNALRGAISGVTTACRNNVGIGENIMRDLTTGTNNVGIGRGMLDSLTTGEYNVAIGANSGAALTGHHCIAIGRNSSWNDGEYRIAIGDLASNSTDHSALIGDTGIVHIRANNNATCDLGTTTSQFKDLYISGAVVSPAWTAVTPEADWAAEPSSTICSYKLLSSDTVTVCGTLQRTGTGFTPAISAPQALLFTLPVGFRPTGEVSCPCRMGPAASKIMNNPTSVTVFADGTVKIASNGYMDTNDSIGFSITYMI